MKNNYPFLFRLYYSLAFLFACTSIFQSAIAQENQNSKGGGDCYFTESAGTFKLGNTKVEITINRSNGALTGLLNKINSIQLLGNGKPDIFRLEYATFDSHGATPNDIWSAGYGSLIYGNKQKVSSYRFEPTPMGGRLVVQYDSLSLGNRKIAVALHYTVEINAGQEETIWQLSIDNHDSGTIREAHFPVAAGLVALDNLIMPNHGGQKLSDPLNKISDEIPYVYLEYPARASMQWFDYFSPTAGLYLASYDKNMDYTRMYFGRQGENPEAAMWLVKYPFVAGGKTWQSSVLAMGIHSGDWHWSADRYRSWLESWVPKPQPPKHIAEMTGGEGALYLKDRDEKTLHTYQDIVNRSRQIKAGPVKTGLMLVGWFYNGHDTYFPEYNANPEMGGDKALQEAVREVHGMGHLVNAYMNGRISNIETQTYKKYGKQWAALGMTRGLGVGNIDFFEIHEGWNKEWEHYKKSGGWFSVMCPSAKGWQDHIVGQVLHGIKNYGFDGIFLDQPGSYYAQLCYNSQHGHSNPATAWGPGYIEIFRRIYQEGRNINPGFAIWTEGMNDVYSQYLDYHTDKNPVWVPMRTHPQAETFVEMWRYTLPWCVTQNGHHKYSFPPSKNKIYGDYYRFIMGIRGVSRNVDPTWGGTAADSVARLAVVSRIEKLWRKGGEFFFYGTFMDDVGIQVSTADLLAKAYTTPNAVAIPVWNTTDKPIKAQLQVDLERMIKKPFRVSGITSLEEGKRIPYKSSGSQVTVNIQLLPHEVTVLVMKNK